VVVLQALEKARWAVNRSTRLCRGYSAVARAGTKPIATRFRSAFPGVVELPVAGCEGLGELGELDVEILRRAAK
jgi:hypothetical protein